MYNMDDGKIVIMVHNATKEQRDRVRETKEIYGLPIEYIGPGEMCFSRVPLGYIHYHEVDAEADKLVNAHLFLFSDENPITMETLSQIYTYHMEEIPVLVLTEETNNAIIYNRLGRIKPSPLNIRAFLYNPLYVSSKLYRCSSIDNDSLSKLFIVAFRLFKKEKEEFTKDKECKVIDCGDVLRLPKSKIHLDSITLYDTQDNKIKKFKGKRTYTSNGFKNRRDI